MDANDYALAEGKAALPCWSEVPNGSARQRLAKPAFGAEAANPMDGAERSRRLGAGNLPDDAPAPSSSN